jgi:ankyrin repeat protein
MTRYVSRYTAILDDNVDLLVEIDSKQDIVSEQYLNRLLHEACYYGSKLSVVYLLNRGANINSRDSKKRIPLHKACIAGHADIVSLILTKSEPSDTRDCYGHTPLFYACIYNKKDIVRLLLNANASPTFKNEVAAKKVKLSATIIDLSIITALEEAHKKLNLFF